MSSTGDCPGVYPARRRLGLQEYAMARITSSTSPRGRRTVTVAHGLRYSWDSQSPGARPGPTTKKGGRMLDRLKEAVNADAWLVHRGRFVDTRFMLESGATQYLVVIHAGAVESVGGNGLRQTNAGWIVADS